ncbi:MAG: hypothetical protein WCJ54_00785 [Actinomycetota bacterium]
MMRGIMFGNFMPLMMIAGAFTFMFISALVLLTIAFWIVYGVKKFKWAKITAIVLSSVLGLLFLGGITMAVCRGFMSFGGAFHGREMLDNFSGIRHGMRRF